MKTLIATAICFSAVIIFMVAVNAQTDSMDRQQGLNQPIAWKNESSGDRPQPGIFDLLGSDSVSLFPDESKNSSDKTFSTDLQSMRDKACQSLYNRTDAYAHYHENLLTWWCHFRSAPHSYPPQGFRGTPALTKQGGKTAGV